ncbi:unnamed protein product [Linum tenue]|uniref:WRKY19-like zinc finger domain-containing protein n=1 Tax=Linum tenue TaxID=586396 RepID=A0AAV0JXN7_9ROSI|nr:unnamed protein product [Linum tenue]
MDNRFRNLDFPAAHPSNAFKIMQFGGVIGATDSRADTVLRLDSLGSAAPSVPPAKGMKRKWSLVNGSMDQQIFGSSLSLGLGRSSSSSDSKGSSLMGCTTMSSAKETDEESSMDLELDFSLHLGNEKTLNPKKALTSRGKALESLSKVDLELSLSTGPAESEITSLHVVSHHHKSPHAGSTSIEFPKEVPLMAGGPFSFGPQLVPLQIPCNEDGGFLLNKVHQPIIPIIPVPSSSVVTPNGSVTSTSGISQRSLRGSGSKTCQIEGCEKGARGASGRCISHGGGRRCQKQGCHKGAEGRTVYCKAHGGGRRCEFLGCTKSAEGRTDFCIAHGGGRRCSHDGCSRAARGKSGLCIRHGGGKRCQKENCTKSAEGLSGLCISHGGGRRCQAPDCTKGAQGSTMFCKAHGGGKRCTAVGCTKGAEGSTPFCKGHGGGKRCAFQGGGICTKSVHGGTNFCVAHGGGKRCAVPECTKSARGRTDYCVRHGGGKRCKFEGCGKSAQGSTDFCKAHGGGKRCSWGHPGSGNVGDGGACNSFARGKTGLCVLHSGLVQDKRVHGGITLGTMVQEDPKAHKSGKMKEVVMTHEDMVLDVGKMGVTANVSSEDGTSSEFEESGGEADHSTTPSSATEGRVHGGSLMAMLQTGSSGASSSGNRQLEQSMSCSVPIKWM